MERPHLGGGQRAGSLLLLLLGLRWSGRGRGREVRRLPVVAPRICERSGRFLGGEWFDQHGARAYPESGTTQEPQVLQCGQSRGIPRCPPVWGRSTARRLHARQRRSFLLRREKPASTSESTGTARSSDRGAPEPHHLADNGHLVVLDRLVGRVLRQKAHASVKRETEMLDGRSRFARDLVGYRRDHDVTFAALACLRTSMLSPSRMPASRMESPSTRWVK